MDKDRCKSNLNTTRNAKCSKPDTCVHLQSIRQKQQQICTQNSTQVLHVVDNFQPNRSEEKFFDCLSVGDSDCKKCASKKISSCKSGRSAKCPNKSDSNRLDDPEALRAALERIAHGTQMMLKNFEQSKNGCRKPCNATLEITARLITDANDSGPNCHFQGRPVTMKMPLEFDPSTGQLGTKSVSSSRNVVCKQSCNNNQPPLESNTACLALMYMRDERPSPQSAPAADASAAAVVDNTNISRKMQTDKSYLQDKWRPNRIDFELESNNVSKNTSPTEIQSKPDVVSIPSKPSQTDTSFLYDKYIISRGERNTQDSQSQTDVKHDLQAMGNIRYPTNYAPVRSDDNLNANENQSSASSQIVSHRSSEPTVPATALMCPSKSMPTVCGSTTFQSASSQLSARCQPCGCRSQDTQWYSLDSDSSHICPSATKQPSTLSPKKCCNRSPVTKPLPSCCQPKMQSIQNQSIRTDFSLRKCSCNSSTSRGKYKSALPTRSGYAALDIDIESNTQYSKRSCNCQATRTSYQRSQSLPCSSVLNKTNRNVNVVYCPKRDYVFGSNQIDVEKALHLDVCNCASDRSASAFAQSKDTCFLTLENNSKAVNATTWNSAKSEKSHGCSKSEDEPAVKNAKSEKSCGSSSTANAIAWNSVQSEKSCGCPKSEVATTWKSAKSEKSFESSRTADATAWNSVQSEKSCGCPKSEVATTWKSAKSEKSFESSRTADATAWNSVQSEKSCGCPKSEVATTWKSAKSEKSFESSRTADATAWNSAKSERSCTCSKTMDASVCNNSAKFDGTCTGTCQSSTIGKASDICSTTMKSIPGTTNATVWNSTRSDKSCGKTGNVNEISCTCSPSDQNIIGKPFNKGASKMSSIPGISNVTARESKKSEKSCGTSERPNASDICSTTMKSIPGTTNASVWNSARSEVCTCGESDKNTILETIVDTESIPSTVNATAWNSLKSDKSCGITETSGAIRWTSIKSEKSCACGPSYQSMISKPSELAVEHLPSAVNVPASNNEKSYRSCGISWQINATASCACNSQNKSNKCTSIPGTINAMSIKSSKSDKSNTKFFPTDSNPETAMDSNDKFRGCDSDNLAKSSKSQSCRAVKSNAINNASENTVSSKSCVAGPSDLEYCSAVTKTNPPTIAWASLHSISQGPVSKSSKTEPTTSCSRSVMAQITCLCSPEQRAMLGERGREADDSPPFVRVKESCLECGVSVVNPCLISATDTTHNGTEDYEISKSCYTTTPSQVTKLVFMQADGFCDCSSSSNTSISKFADNEDYETSNKSPRNVDGDPAKNSNSRSFACPKAMNSGLKSQSKSKHLSMKSAISCSCDKEVTDYTSTRSEQTHCSCNIKTSTYDLSIQDFDMEPESVGVVMNCNTTVCVDKATFDKLSSMNQSNQSSRSQNNARERLFEMVDLVTNTRDPGVNRGDVAKQIIRELTMILRKEEEESKPPKLSFEDCMEAVQRGEKLAKNQLQTEADVNRMQCLGQMEQYLQSCFPQKKLKAVQETEIVAFEIDPNFIPYHASPSTSEPEAETRDVVQFASCYTEVDTRYVGSCYTDDNESKQISPKGGSLGTRSMKDAESRLTGSIKTNEPKQITSNRGSVGRTSMKDTESRVSGSIKTDIASDKFLSPLASTGIPSESWLSTIPNASSEISEAQASIEPIAALEDTTIVSSANMASPNSDANTSKRDSKVESLSKGGNESMSSVHPSSGRDESSRSKEKSLGHSKPQLPEPQIYINSEVQCNNELCPASVVQGPNRTEEACDMCELDVNDPLSPLTDRERLLCEYLLRRMCELCDEDKELNGDLEEDVSADRPSLNQPCLCCHCRALVCDNQCKTISKTMDSAMYDPVAEMKFFIDSVVFDLQAMEHVMNKNKISPKSPKPSSCMGSAPGESFPVTITDISSLGCRALYVRWELQDCSGVGGYEIYVDGHLTNRFFSHRHEAGVISNVDVSKRHQIILRAQAIGQEFPGEERAICNAIINAHPEMLVGAQQPWSPSVYFYEP
ncbi:uncharacterized protein LOC133836371 isoform X1 [Drosophila sulfurigaster albostrigata]|uniref:uncharacterized protein LOC133836371 isoform X1 n=1 Tax=Drosophila sulfurigaster albostrigata TaxID=89887 RepID=UPI002D21A0C1|nr:uncharacterized protein LOC133836371 isoform X1 [Drosophila sulfurigaster albostrigata]